jgi:transposase
MSDSVGSPRIVAGVDIGKSSLQLALQLASGRCHEQCFDNSPQGREELAALCQNHQVQLVVMEASGGLELDVLMELARCQVAVSIITPVQSASFARALGQKAKTDVLDARMLALFAARIHPDPSPAPSPRQCELRELSARRRQLIQHLVQEKNRTHQVRDKRVKKSLALAIAFLEKQLEQIDQHIRGLLASDPELMAAVRRLDSVPAIGPHTAAHLLIACPELGTLNRQQVASLGGLAPFNRDSGTFSGKRSVRGGRETIRSALYMATVTAIRWNPVIRQFYQRLRENGKLKMVALTAAMRKLLIILNSMMREKKSWTEFISHTP